MKKKFIIIILVIAIVIGLGVGGFFIYRKTKSVQDTPAIEKDKVVASVYLEVNPSIRIDLDSDKKVIDVVALNEDAKEIIRDSYRGTELDYVISRITNELEEKGYTRDAFVILVGATGDIELSEVENLINEEYANRKLNGTVMTTIIDDESKKKAEEYGISPVRAALIEDMVEANKDLDFEGLTETAVEGLYLLKNAKIEEPLKEEKEEETKTSTTSTTTKSSTSTSTSSSSSTKQPSDPTKDIDAWCRYNENRNPYGHEKPMMLDSYSLSNKMESYVMNTYNISSTEEFLARGYTTSQKDNRSSYCVAYLVTFVTRNWYKVFYVDSVTGNIIDEVTKSVPSLITDIEARNRALNYYGLTADDAWDYAPGEARLTLDGMGGNEVYKYSVVLSLKNGESHYVVMNATNGQIISAN